ncbi:DUF4145 domain-containing protein [uncultured Roseibium sp.]|uniref:DUF4145 domain-containing protein n=1 Tax=uncultured Roseibium sp. TaxID=1936171 RepID=UPI00261BD2BE|nr:DUF4145 domain-containing protein [uncultured Roseibium sp.]
MNSKSKDSPEVVEFMLLFNRLKEWFDDAPDLLAKQALGDEEAEKLCARLSQVGFFLTMNERRARSLFTGPVDPAFLAAWRDYEERYQAVVAGVWLSNILPRPATNGTSRIPSAELQWQAAHEDAKEQASGIEAALDFAKHNADQADRWNDQPDFIEEIQEGTAAWRRLKKDTGFDSTGVFRRRELIPFVLVPRRVLDKCGETEAHSMLKNLQQAHDAFVFGAPFAAIALMRSIMEAVLRDHYEVSGYDLNERIKKAHKLLPPGANQAALHRLRKLANAILHIDQEKDEGLPKLDDVQLEKEIVSLLFVLRALIEGARVK